MSLERIERRYYKKVVKHMISGLPLPTDEDGVVRDKYFVQCDFHPSCEEVRFENCTYSGCSGLHYLSKRVRCTTRGLTSFGG